MSGYWTSHTFGKLWVPELVLRLMCHAGLHNVSCRGRTDHYPPHLGGRRGTSGEQTPSTCTGDDSCRVPSHWPDPVVERCDVAHEQGHVHAHEYLREVGPDIYKHRWCPGPSDDTRLPDDPQAPDAARSQP